MTLDSTHKVLCVNCDTKTDKFVFDFQEIAKNVLVSHPLNDTEDFVTHFSIR